MSNNATIIYDAIIALIPTLFTDKTRIADPYNLESNKSPFLRDGWGATVRPAAPGAIDYTCASSSSQSYGIVLTKEVIRLDSDTTDFDTKTKELLVEFQTLQNSFTGNDQLGVPNNVGLINFTGHDGINFIQTEKLNFISMEVGFAIDVTESI